MNEITMRKAISQSLFKSMDEDSSTLMIGEVLQSRGGAAKITYGFEEKYGPLRAIETPISENALVGMGLGAALAHHRVFVEVYSADFLFCAGSEVFNDIAKWRYMQQWQNPIKLVLRMPMGSLHNSAGPEHTQSIEGYLHHLPGIRVIVPGTASHAYGALRQAIELGDPVIFLESRRLYDQTEDFTIDENRDWLAAEVITPGTDLTIVAWGAMRRVALAAAEALKDDQGLSVEVIDPVTIKPMDFEMIAKSVQKTGKLVVVEESPKTGSVAAEILTSVIEINGEAPALFERVTMPDAPHPFHVDLEPMVIPGVQQVVEIVQKSKKS